MKTLKQLIKKAQKEDELSFGGYTEDYLRQSAIEWIKELQSADHNTVTNGLPVTDSRFKSYNPEPIIFWIKHYFGITEEELR